MRAEVDRAIPARLLTGPNTVLNFCHDGTTDRAVGADGFLDFGCCARHNCLCLTNVGASKRDGGRKTPDRKTRAAQECTTIDGLVGKLTEKDDDWGLFATPDLFFLSIVVSSKKG